MTQYKFTPTEHARKIFNAISSNKESFVASDPKSAITSAIGHDMFERHVESTMPKHFGSFAQKIYNNYESGYKMHDGAYLGTIQAVKM